MRKRRSVLLLSYQRLLLLSVSAWSATAQVVPLSLHGHVPIAKVRLNGQGPFRMMVDTGATSCTLAPRIAKALHLIADYQVLNVTPSGNQWAPGTSTVEVEIGSRSQPNIEFLWRDTPGLVEAGIPVDGVIGQSLLSRFNYLLDYRAKQLVLDPEGSIAPELPGSRIAFELVSRRMLLPAANPIDGEVRLVLDSGASNLCLWRAGNYEVLQISAGLLGLNGQRRVTMVRMPMLRVGDHVLQKLDAVVAPQAEARREDGLLPAALFKSIYVSNSESYVKLQR